MMKNYRIYFGLGGGFGHEYETVEAVDQEDAENIAYHKALEAYENYEGMHGVPTAEEVAEEEGIDPDDPDYHAAMDDAYREVKEGWVSYGIVDGEDGDEPQL